MIPLSGKVDTEADIPQPAFISLCDVKKGNVLGEYEMGHMIYCVALEDVRVYSDRWEAKCRVLWNDTPFGYSPGAEITLMLSVPVVIAKRLARFDCSPETLVYFLRKNKLEKLVNPGKQG